MGKINIYYFMLNIKDIKFQKKLIYLLATLIISASVGYSGWFLYNNFYKTINWRSDSSLNHEVIIQHVHMDSMKTIVEKIERKKEVSDPLGFNINIDFR